MPGPSVERRPHLGQIPEPIVNTGNAAERAGGVIENALDDVRGDAEALHTGLKPARHSDVMSPETAS